jgi:hypothetical protein
VQGSGVAPRQAGSSPGDGADWVEDTCWPVSGQTCWHSLYDARCLRYGRDANVRNDGALAFLAGGLTRDAKMNTTGRLDDLTRDGDGAASHAVSGKARPGPC